MKKIWVLCILSVAVIGLVGCGTVSNSTSGGKTSTEQKSNKEYEQMEEELGEKGVEIELSKEYSDLTLTREKSIDYDYFEMLFEFDGETKELYKVVLQLKGNIDGELKDRLFFEISKGRMVESTVNSNSNIDALAEVLDSLGYDDKKMLGFAQWYYYNNK
ncbi:hypothetical protein IW492_01870 [Enterococcus sp. BWB1-3]|uniref:hypothetical protein n=1 Tax=Enterococcus sp. BWB1-3 TaxID=2787713 RepID=UPI001922CE4E|nr:hypothetical protein [Enterococcus sp. BWB1-3]MBL1227976.1 hypothetical protein [Enterococcus sp. BWB1-3]